jgi:septum formation protein
MKIVLASASPRRKQILSNLGIKFEIEISSSELEWSGEAPYEYAKKTAYHKARDVINRRKEQKEIVVIGADTIVVSEDKVIGKPVNEDDAFKMLCDLCGKTHSVITGIAVVSHEREEVDFVETKVHFRKVSKNVIKRYVKTGEPYGKAGGYAIQGLAAPMIDYIDGDYYNVVGLPVAKLFEILEKFGIELYSWL